MPWVWGCLELYDEQIIYFVICNQIYLLSNHISLCYCICVVITFFIYLHALEHFCNWDISMLFIVLFSWTWNRNTWSWSWSRRSCSNYLQQNWFFVSYLYSSVAFVGILWKALSIVFDTSHLLTNGSDWWSQ